MQNFGPKMHFFGLRVGFFFFCHSPNIPVHLGFNTPSKDKTRTEESEQQAIAAAPAFQVFYHLILLFTCF